MSSRLLLFVLLIPGIGKAQSPTLFRDSSVTAALTHYTELMGTSSRLYSGSQYNDIELHEYDSGHAYFQSNDWIRGTIHYNDQYFTKVDILYNLLIDEVIIENPYNVTKIQLIKERVSDFTIDGHHFVLLMLDSSKLLSRNGFYDELYGGTSKVYAKRTKVIQLKIENGKERKSFTQKNRYFIRKGNEMVSISSKASVVQAFSDRKAEMKKKLSKSPFSFRKQREIWYAWAARQYDETQTGK